VTSSLLQLRSRRVSRALPLLLAFVLASSAAHADEAGARVHFKRGVELYDKKQYAPALESFRAAYAEKPVPGIKRNIALCLKGLGRPVEAATAFDDALDEGDAIKPEVRAAMEQELAELAKVVATVRLTVVASADKHPLETAVVTVDKVALPPGALRRPVRLEPGIHVFAAHVDGLGDPPEKKLSLLAGSPVDATFEIGERLGTLTVTPSIPDAVVQVDMAEPRRGVWTGKLLPGTHRVVVSAPDYQTQTTDVVVSSDANVDYAITLLRPGELPPSYTMPVRKPPPAQKTRYLVPMIAYEGQSMRLGPALGENAGGTKRAFTGASFGVRAGYRASRSFALELYADVGQVTETYAISPATTESTTKIIHWQVTPMLRFATIGPIRFTTATGVGVHGLSVDADVATKSLSTTTKANHKGSGVSASWLVDLGMQFDVGPLFLEAVAFFDMHGVGTTRDDATNERLLYSSPGTRAGVRAGLGIQF
jgi:hypothetical protein